MENRIRQASKDSRLRKERAFGWRSTEERNARLALWLKEVGGE